MSYNIYVDQQATWAKPIDLISSPLLNNVLKYNIVVWGQEARCHDYTHNIYAFNNAWWIYMASLTLFHYCHIYSQILELQKLIFFNIFHNEFSSVNKKKACQFWIILILHISFQFTWYYELLAQMWPSINLDRKDCN